MVTGAAWRSTVAFVNSVFIGLSFMCCVTYSRGVDTAYSVHVILSQVTLLHQVRIVNFLLELMHFLDKHAC